MAMRFTDVGHGLAISWDDQLRINDPDLEVIVDLRLSVSGARLVVDSLKASRREGGPGVSIDALKSLPLVSMVASTATKGVLGGLVSSSVIEKPDSEPVHEYGPVGDEIQQLTELERVALVYRLAYFLNMPPTAAVAEDLEVSHAVAAKRVQAARRAGLLEQTTPGKKGA